MPFGDYTGFITPFVLEKIMESTGAYLLITSITMALMSTGSGEVMAVSSIIVYDIYRVYINPFRYLASLFGGDGGCGETVYVAYVIFAVGGFVSYCNSKMNFLSLKAFAHTYFMYFVWTSKGLWKTRSLQLPYIS